MSEVLWIRNICGTIPRSDALRIYVLFTYVRIHYVTIYIPLSFCIQRVTGRQIDMYIVFMYV